MEKNCLVCGNEFIPHITHPYQRTCGKKKCVNKAEYEKNKHKYKEKWKERYNKIKKTEEYKKKVREAVKKYKEKHPERFKEQNRRYKQKNREKILAKLRKYKLKERICSFCNKSFMPDKNHPLAKCCSAKCRNKLWAKNNPERVKELNINKSKRYRERHPEKIKEFTRERVKSGKANEDAKRWRKNNPERVKELDKKKYWKNPEKYIQQVKDYRKTEAGKISHRASERKLRYKKRSELERDFPFTKAKQEKIRGRDEDTCVYCHNKPEIITFDHIIPQIKKGSNSINNLVICCLTCNTSKGKTDVFIWCKERKREVPEIVIKLLKKQKEQKTIQSK